MTVFKEAGQLLRIFIGEANKYKRMPLYEWIVQQARSQGMAGATVLRGIQGFGANSLIHTTKILRLSEDLPVVVEIIDTKEKIESFHADGRVGDVALFDVEIDPLRGERDALFWRSAAETYGIDQQLFLNENDNRRKLS